MVEWKYPQKIRCQQEERASAKNPIKRASPGCFSPEHEQRTADGLPARSILHRGTEVSEGQRRPLDTGRGLRPIPLWETAALREAAGRPGIGSGGPCLAAAAPGPNSRGKDPRDAWQGREATEGPHPKEQCLSGGRETDTVIGFQPRLERDTLGPIRTLESKIEPAAPRLPWGPIKRSPEGGLGPQKFRFERGPLNKIGECVHPK
ncbi:hypothetical protein NDU88_000359 [Pleurodeles waltl]|uniref:Uncharacterized protein n=1 Tax=Pleurodeles waltl TaxID=8319 RepID=A0AAV7TEQ6_PLEWA|nr:hypothetical protein NDU88_000359 [Pleurodeles waltl]